MKLPHHLALAAVLPLAMLGAAPEASAQAQAQSSFDAFRYQIVDLNPYDGIDAGISFGDASVGAWTLLRDENGIVLESKQANTQGDPVRVLTDTAQAYLLAEATSRSASSLATVESGYGEAFTDSFLGFVLAPYTQVTFSIDASAIASAANTPGLFSYVALNGRITDENGNAVFDTDGLSSYLASSDTLSVTLGSAAVARTGWLEFATAAYAQAQAVPEPASMAMLVAGMAVVGGFARRGAFNQPRKPGARP